MRQIVVEAETPDDPRSLFRLRVDQTLIAEGLTSAQAQIAVGEILEEITTMEQPKFPDPRPYIPRSRQDPKIGGKDDAEIISDRIAKLAPFPRDFVA